MTDDVLRCPNCSAVASRAPISCEVCGYEARLAPELFWLYLGGGALFLFGIAVGIGGVLTQGNAPQDWDAPLRGWWPLGPTPQDANWMGGLVAGIGWSLVGLGFTRHFKIALWCGLVLGSWGALSCIGALALERASMALAGSLLILQFVLLALVLRLGIALRRTPERDVARLQAGVREREELVDRPPR